MCWMPMTPKEREAYYFRQKQILERMAADERLPVRVDPVLKQEAIEFEQSALAKVLGKAAK